MQINFDQKSPVEKKLLPDLKRNPENPPKKEIIKAKVTDENELSLGLTAAMADLIIQQNLS